MASVRGSKVSKTGKKRVTKKAARTATKVAKKSKRKTLARGQNGPLALPSRLSIEGLAKLQSQLAALLETDGSIAIDASAVESVDTAALQLLTAFVNKLKNQARALEWREPSHAFVQSASLIDVARHLGVESEADYNDNDDDGLCPVF